jgi:hypothetical protein
MVRVVFACLLLLLLLLLQVLSAGLVWQLVGVV